MPRSFMSDAQKPLSVDLLLQVWDEMMKEPHVRFVVSKFIPADKAVQAPRYFDPRRDRFVDVYIIGGDLWKQLEAERPPAQAPFPLHTMPVEFIPRDWRP